MHKHGQAPGCNGRARGRAAGNRASTRDGQDWATPGRAIVADCFFPYSRAPGAQARAPLPPHAANLNRYISAAPRLVLARLFAGQARAEGPRLVRSAQRRASLSTPLQQRSAICTPAWDAAPNTTTQCTQRSAPDTTTRRASAHRPRLGGRRPKLSQGQRCRWNGARMCGTGSAISRRGRVTACFLRSKT